MLQVATVTNTVNIKYLLRKQNLQAGFSTSYTIAVYVGCIYDNFKLVAL